MEKTDKELIEYSLKIILRGDSYRSILGYLKKHRYKEEEINSIVKRIRIEEKKLDIKKKPKSINPINLILGLAFIIGGIFLTVYLWDKGIFSVISIGIIGIGFLALSNGEKDITKRIRF